MKHLLAFCESELRRALHEVEALVRLESPSTDKAAVDRCAVAVERLMRASGGRVEVREQAAAGNALVADFGQPAGPPVLLLCHIDTVWPVGHLEQHPLRLDDGRLFGPGAFDMKGGLVVGLLAVRALEARMPGTAPHVRMLATGDEEIGSRSSRALVEEQARASRAVLVLEPPLPGGVLKTSRKGCGEFELEVTGVAAHAGVEPEKGASAVLELAEQVLAVDRLQDRERGTTINVGLISGGTRANVVPDAARAVIDVRAPSRAEADRVQAALRALRPQRPHTALALSGGFDRPPLERSPAVAALFREAQAVAADLGFELREGSTGGGSDGNFTAALGVPTLDGLGAEGDGAHAAHEHILVERLPRRAALLAGLLLRLAPPAAGARASDGGRR